MKSFLLFSIISFLLLSCGQNESLNSDSKIKTSSIVNGEEVDPAKVETKYIVNLNNLCAGSIIAPKWILTAAHCKKAFRNIKAGSITTSDRKNILLKVRQTYFHPKYKKTLWGERYDYALIELKTPIDFKETGLKSIKIADAEFENAGGMNDDTSANVLGWGHTIEDGYGSNVLNIIKIKILNFEKANGHDSYRGKLNESMFVAGDGEGKKDACNGDSGGPLTITHPMTGELVLAGIVSWGGECASKDYPGVYAKVSHAHEWIMKTISQQE